METQQNPILGDSILASNWLNPDYLFNQGAVFFHQISNFFNNNGAEITSVYHTLLFFFGLFFLTVISYSSIRLMEIRTKEHKHLKHEIAEYAHHQAERQKKLQEGEAVSKNPQWLKTLGYLF